MTTTPALTPEAWHECLAQQCDPDSDRPGTRQPVAAKWSRRWWGVGADGYRMLAVEIAEPGTYPLANDMQRGYERAIANILSIPVAIETTGVPLAEFRAWLGAPVPWAECPTCHDEDEGVKPCPTCHGDGPAGYIRPGWLGRISINLNLLALALDGLPDGVVELGSLDSVKTVTGDGRGVAIISANWRAIVMGMGLRVRALHPGSRWAEAPVCPWWARSGAMS